MSSLWGTPNDVPSSGGSQFVEADIKRSPNSSNDRTVLGSRLSTISRTVEAIARLRVVAAEGTQRPAVLDERDHSLEWSGRKFEVSVEFTPRLRVDLAHQSEDLTEVHAAERILPPNDGQES